MSGQNIFINLEFGDKNIFGEAHYCFKHA